MPRKPAHKPIVLVVSNRENDIRGTPGHFVRETYINALTEASGAQPLLLPASGEIDLKGMSGMIAGLLLTGAPAMVDPARYDTPQEFPDEQLDRARDSMTFSLINDAIVADIPLFAICRGFQELNVACGGSLHQFVHKAPGLHDHRPKPGLTTMENYLNTAHTVTVQKGGLFEKWGLPSRFPVNSIHTQGANKLGAGLRAEAVSTEDGLVEAVSIPGKRFVVGTQFHPEGDCFVNPASRRLFEEFGRVLRGEAQSPLTKAAST